VPPFPTLSPPPKAEHADQHGNGRDHEAQHPNRERRAQVVAKQAVDRTLHGQHRAGDDAQRQPAGGPRSARKTACASAAHDRHGAGNNGDRAGRHAWAQYLRHDAE
jgi:hypothetical protein